MDYLLIGRLQDVLFLCKYCFYIGKVVFKCVVVDGCVKVYVGFFNLYIQFIKQCCYVWVVGVVEYDKVGIDSVVFDVVGVCMIVDLGFCFEQNYMVGWCQFVCCVYIGNFFVNDSD